MEKVDYYSGQIVNETGARTIDDQMAEQFASFGQYNYGVPQVMSPGAYNPQYGLGGYNNFQYYNPVMSNPAFVYMNQMGRQPMYQPYQQPQIPQGDITYDIPGITFGNDYLPPMDYEELISKMQLEYWTASVNDEAKKDVQNIRQGIQYNAYGQPYNAYNYYGNPYYYNPYQYNSYAADFQDRLKELQEDARERRTKLNINLSRLAQNIQGHQDYDDNVIQEIYRGKTVTVPGMTYTDIYETNRLSTLVPFNNANSYRERDAAVSAEYNKYINKSSDMQETFENMALVWNKYELEEEKHRRRSRVKEQYNSDTYKYLIKKSAMERYAKEHGITLPGFDMQVGTDSTSDYYTNRFNQIKQQALQSFPTLAATSTLADDGTLHINYTEINENLNEAEYSKKRDRFNAFLQSIPGVFVNNQAQGGGT